MIDAFRGVRSSARWNKKSRGCDASEEAEWWSVSEFSVVVVLNG